MKPKKIINVINTSWWLDNAIITVLYFVFAALVLKLPQSPLGSPFWPSAGIAVGALLARGRSRWVGVFLGATLNSFWNSKVPFLLAVIAGLAPAIGALISTTLVLRFNRTNYFLRYVKHFVVFVLVVTFSGTSLQALMGSAIVLWAGLIPLDIYWTVTWGWWVGDVVGILVFAPLVLAWWQKQPKIKLDDKLSDFTSLDSIEQREQTLDIADNQFNYQLNYQINQIDCIDRKELFGAITILIVICYLALIESQPIEYLLLPSLLWSAFRFGSKATTLIVTATAMVASISTAYRTGIFYKVSQESNSLLLLQIFMGVISITAIMVLTLVAENNRASAKLKEQVFLKDQAYIQLDQVNKNLEDIITERTSELVAANREISFLNQQLTTENMRMSSELAVTRRLQEMILPKVKELNNIAELDIVGFMESADEVGGDYYDVLQQNGRIKIGIGDVTGHGLESGVIMIMVQTAIRALLINGETDPVKFLSTVNHTIYENIQRMNSDKNLSLILMDYHDHVLRLSGQHESVIVVRKSGEVEIIDTDPLGFPIGLTDEISEFIFEVNINLELGDVVVLYTDGITEAENEDKQFYGLQRLIEVIRNNYQNPVDQIREQIIADVREFIGGGKVYDDITLVVMKRKI